MSRFFLPLFFLTLPVLALDNDNDGMDDLWQQRHGIAPFTGSLDPDNDGRINLEEARNMSDPHAVNTNGSIVIIRDITPQDGLPDVWQAQFGITVAQKFDDSDGDQRTNIEEGMVLSHPFVADVPFSLMANRPPAVERPGPDSFIARMGDSAAGRRYRLEVSDTLLPDSWTTATLVSGINPYQWGTGDEISAEAVTGAAQRKFFRWVIDDPDSDGDFLPDFLEMQAGTQVNNADSDGDGDSDGYEWMEGTDAMNANSGSAAQSYETGEVEASVTFLGYYKSATNKWYGGNITQSDVQWSGSAPQSSGLEKYWGYNPKWSDKLGNIDYPPHSAGGAVPWRDYGSRNAIAYTGISINTGAQVGYATVHYVQARLGSLPQLTAQPWDVIQRRLAFQFDRNYNGTSPAYSHVQMLEFAIPKNGHVSAHQLMEPVAENNKYQELVLLNPAITGYDGAIDMKGRLDAVIEPWVMIPAGGTRQVLLDGGNADGGHTWIYRFNGVTPVGQGVEDNAVRTLPHPSNAVLLIPPADMTGELGSISVGISKGNGTDMYAENEPLMRCLVLPRQDIKVVVHPITLLSTSGAVRAAPQNCPTAASLKSYLDGLFGAQANVISEVIVLPGVSVNWDVGVGVGGSTWGSGDGILNLLLSPYSTFASDGETPYRTTPSEVNLFSSSDEQSTIMTASPTVGGRKVVNVYFLASPDGIDTSWFFPPRHPHRQDPRHLHRQSVLGYAGKASPDNNGVLFVWDYEANSVRPNHRWAIAHEIMHYVAKVGHSTTPDNDNHQANSDNEKRLMTGRTGAKRAASPKVLIKPEWVKLNAMPGFSQ